MEDSSVQEGAKLGYDGSETRVRGIRQSQSGSCYVRFEVRLFLPPLLNAEAVVCEKDVQAVRR